LFLSGLIECSRGIKLSFNLECLCCGLDSLIASTILVLLLWFATTFFNHPCPDFEIAKSLKMLQILWSVFRFDSSLLHHVCVFIIVVFKLNQIWILSCAVDTWTGIGTLKFWELQSKDIWAFEKKRKKVSGTDFTKIEKEFDNNLKNNVGIWHCLFH